MSRVQLTKLGPQGGTSTEENTRSWPASARPHSPVRSGEHGPRWTFAAAQADPEGSRQGVRNRKGSCRSWRATTEACSGSPTSKQGKTTPVERTEVTHTPHSQSSCPPQARPTPSTAGQGWGRRSSFATHTHTPITKTWLLQETKETAKRTKNCDNQSHSLSLLTPFSMQSAF